MRFVKISKARLTDARVGGIVGATLVLLAGLFLLLTPFHFSQSFITSSYDWSFQISHYFSQHDISDSPVVIIYLDEESHKTLEQPLNQPWNRALHAKLLNRLTADGAAAVVFDIIFSDPGPDLDADAEFEQAIRKNGKVVLAGDVTRSGSSIGLVTGASLAVTRPLERFRTNAAGWGLAMLEVDKDLDFTVREHFPGLTDQDIPSLSFATARLLGFDVTRNPTESLKQRWVYYYGKAETVPHVSYAEALGSKPRSSTSDGVLSGFFKNKIVFVGARPKTGFFDERRDELRSPFTGWAKNQEDKRFMPSVEVHTTQTLNLRRGESLSRLSPAAEMAVLICISILFGCGLLRFKPLTAAALSALGTVAVMAAVLSLFIKAHVWFPWTIIVVQIPLALLWCIVFKSIDWYVARRLLERERQVADARIREQAALLDKAQDAIIVHDLDWQASFWNKSAERLYGWTAEEVLFESLADSILNGEPDKLKEAREAVIKSGEWMGELKQKTKAGSHITVQSRWSLVRAPDGSPQSVLVINTDMTEKKKLEAQFLRAQRMESIGTLAGGIAHDLNNVLSPIVMGVELLSIKVSDEKSQKLLRTMSASARRGADMVKQVLGFARGHEGERTVLQLSHLVKEMQKIVRDTFPKSIEMQTQIAPDLWNVLGDATQWHQVLLNLCVNARDAMPEGGRISIAVSNVAFTEADAKRLLGAKPINYVLLSASDSGTGIPPEIIDKIFEPFFTTKEIGKGTGLGLSTVISIVKSHGAVLELNSEVGKGTTFNIYIPAINRAVANTAPRASLDQLRGNNELVLVVDDEPAVLEVLKSTLTTYGYRVLTAIHGQEAISLCSEKREEKIGLAIMDMMMPILDGPKTIRALRRMCPDLRFLAVSGLQQNDAIKDLLEKEKIGFLPKPLTTEKLLEALRNAFTASVVATDKAPVAVA